MKNLKCVMWSLRALIGRLRPSNKSMVIRVNEAGTLPSLIASHLKYRIVELTLIGELNGTDLRYIREMSGCDANGKETGGCLSVLDLSGVNIVNGECRDKRKSYLQLDYAEPYPIFVSANIIKSVITDMNPICNTQFYIYYIDSVDN